MKRRLDRLTRALPGLEQGDVRALHRVRVASRRLREIVPVLQLDHASSKRLTRRLRKLTSRLGTVRELDVMLLGIDEMHAVGRVRSSALAQVGVAVSKDRDHARRRLFARLSVNDIWRLAKKLERCVDDLRLAESSSSRTTARNWKWAVESRLEHRAVRLAKALHEAGAVYIPERLHVVRIALKKMRYALELTTEVAGARTSADLRALMRTQELLGQLHDLQMLVDRVRQVQAALTPPSIPIWRDLDTLIASLEDDNRRLHARYMRMRDQLTSIAERLGGLAAGGAQRARRAG
ncbi:MAG TPA: CHAD domain-containing protein [Vicinamibacterales bacterium]|nr:CHAD domain-containing protein [Vicinamibacterales bacterium]